MGHLTLTTPILGTFCKGMAWLTFVMV